MLLRHSPLLVALILATTVATAGEPCSSHVAAAVADPSRLDSHRARDGGRQPAKVIDLVRVQPGDKVAELAAGSGYYTGLLSRVVGDGGKVYAVDPEPVFKAFPQARDTFAKYAEADPRENVSYSVADSFDTLRFPEKLDAVFMVLYYHDTIWTGEDRQAMNKAIFDALKPGGRYLVVDHHAEKGAGDEVTKSLHRMEAGVVKPEVLAAGFELVADSDILSHPSDPRTVSVFDESMRGKTDRFVYLFEKPAR